MGDLREGTTAVAMAVPKTIHASGRGFVILPHWGRSEGACPTLGHTLTHACPKLGHTLAHAHTLTRSHGHPAPTVLLYPTLLLHRYLERRTWANLTFTRTIWQ